jgi:8-oxo-dGTP pyrophosphatase MutT (NUDIX family)
MADQQGKDQLPVLHQVSSGGVVFRGSGNDAKVVIIQTASEHRWQLPKGLIDAGETVEEAAIREVREESGIDAEIIELADEIEYWFTASYHGERRRYHKMVHFFVMNYLSGRVEDHDHEVAEARWLSVPEALKLLHFKTERDVVEKAAKIYSNHNTNNR